MSNVPRFERLLSTRASDVLYHREAGAAPCPCRTALGYRNPKWHLENPSAPVCNEHGMLNAVVVEFAVKAFVQPVQAGAVRRLTGEYVQQLFGEIQMDDHLGMFPLSWGGNSLDFYEWSSAGEDYIVYDGRRFIVVSANKIPDPANGQPHHWEVGLRLVKNPRT
jgi:hypothetical protein